MEGSVEWVFFHCFLEINMKTRESVLISLIPCIIKLVYIFVSSQYRAIKEGRDPDLSDYQNHKLTEENVGYRMLKSMGWTEGMGLGAEGKGITAPVNQLVCTHTMYSQKYTVTLSYTKVFIIFCIISHTQTCMHTHMHT